MGVDAEADQTWGTYLRSVFAISAGRDSAALPDPASPAPPDDGAGHAEDAGGPGLQHGCLLRHQHQLAELLAARTPWATWRRCRAWRSRTSSRRPSASRWSATLIRGFTRNRTDRLGNFWVDLTRILIRADAAVLVRVRVVLVGLRRRSQKLGDHMTVVHTINGDQSLYTGGRPRAGGHQAPGHQRRRHLQRQQRAPFENPTGVDEPARDLPAAGASRSRCRAPSARWSARTRQGYTILSGDGDHLAIGSLACLDLRRDRTTARCRPGQRARATGGQGDPGSACRTRRCSRRARR